KYSRANFSDLLAQTRAIATAPQGSLGGKNPVQVGLGSTINSMTRIFSQGSVQNSDKNTDMAIQGDGFFIVTPDGGNTYKYTRSGDFKFDAAGNFVDNNGFIARGWMRDEETGKVDTNNPIQNINIPPGLTTPANATSEIVLKANLNSGALIESFSPSFSVASTPPPSNGVVSPAPFAKDSNGNTVESGDMGVMFNDSGEALGLVDGQGVWISFKASTVGPSVAVGTVAADTNGYIEFQLDDGSKEKVSYTLKAGNTAEQNAAIIADAIDDKQSIIGVTATYDTNGQITLTNDNSSTSAAHNIKITDESNSGFSISTGAANDPGADKTAFKYVYGNSGDTPGFDKGFTTIAELREAMEKEARHVGDNDGAAGAGDGTADESNITISINERGQFVITNPGASDDGDYAMDIKVTGISSNTVSENERFTKVMSSLNTILPIGAGTSLSQSLNVATHSSSIDVFDSLGSKHTLRTEFRKVDVDKWDITVTSPSGTMLNAGYTVTNADGTTKTIDNEARGYITFNEDGSLKNLTIPSVSFTANNGSAPNQPISLSLGSTDSFDGMTSFDNPSSTSGISQDGYTGGDLVGIRIDQSGTLIGSFSNGRSMGLAQVAMAKFTNNEGLSTEGGNIFVQTANSGEPIIGTAATSGRGFIQSSALEASNVDLSRALTQLIIVQRGYQANGKTITTSDQMLQTLIGLKN
ncbi:MAG: flagellar hook protein FlgE, partial [Campylobacterales bacterium]|nr:flagellar hook protein FlgE [Campylobacterales bacterium]